MFFCLKTCFYPWSFSYYKTTLTKKKKKKAWGNSSFHRLEHRTAEWEEIYTRWNCWVPSILPGGNLTTAVEKGNTHRTRGFAILRRNKSEFRDTKAPRICKWTVKDKSKKRKSSRKSFWLRANCESAVEYNLYIKFHETGQITSAKERNITVGLKTKKFPDLTKC